jgi:hypothetical protein
MKFSVVVPLYNKARFVGAAVASALAQTLPPLEVIVIDDGSTDGSLQALAALPTDPRLRVVTQSNRGVSAARNLGIALAQGDWVALLDADDQWHPQFLQALAGAHRRYPQADLLATGFRPIEGAQAQAPCPLAHWSVTRGADDAQLVTDLRRRWMQGAPLCTSSVAIRAQRLRELGICFREGESYGEDLDLWFRLAEAAPVATVPGAYVALRYALEGALSCGARRIKPAFIERMQAQARNFTLPASQRLAAGWFVTQSLCTLAREALADGARGEALQWLRQAPSGWRVRRWWVTVLMALCLPGSWADRWQQWRIRSTRQYNQEGA